MSAGEAPKLRMLPGQEPAAPAAATPEKPAEAALAVEPAKGCGGRPGATVSTTSCGGGVDAVGSPSHGDRSWHAGYVPGYRSYVGVGNGAVRSAHRCAAGRHDTFVRLERPSDDWSSTHGS